MMTETAPELPTAEPKAASSAAVGTLRVAAQKSHEHSQTPPVATLGQLQGPPVATLEAAQPQSPPSATLDRPQGPPVVTLGAAQAQRPHLVALDLPPHGAPGADAPLPSFSMQPGIVLHPGGVVQQPPAAGAPNGGGNAPPSVCLCVYVHVHLCRCLWVWVRVRPWNISTLWSLLYCSLTRALSLSSPTSLPLSLSLTLSLPPRYSNSKRQAHSVLGIEGHPDKGKCMGQAS